MENPIKVKVNWDLGNNFDLKFPTYIDQSQLKCKRILTMHAFDEEIQFRQANISLKQRWLLINKEQKVSLIRIISGFCHLNQSLMPFSIIAK
jgi:hypothetical protein